MALSMTMCWEFQTALLLKQVRLQRQIYRDFQPCDTMSTVGKSSVQPGASTGETTMWFTWSRLFLCNSVRKMTFNHNRRNTHARNVSETSFHNSTRVLKLQTRCGDLLSSAFWNSSFNMYLLQKRHSSRWKTFFWKEVNFILLHQ